VKRGQPERKQVNGVTGHRAAPKPARVGPSAEQNSLGPRWSHVVQGGRIVKATIPTPPEPSPKSVTEAPHQIKVAVTRKGSAAANPALKSTKALRQVQVKIQRKR
jgi:hypothetical protein